jgi:hypothetical protein
VRRIAAYDGEGRKVLAFGLRNVKDISGTKTDKAGKSGVEPRFVFMLFFAAVGV